MRHLLKVKKGWITEFHRALEIRLSQLLGERPNIWRDSRLDGNHVFSDEIISQFPKVVNRFHTHSKICQV